MEVTEEPLLLIAKLLLVGVAAALILPVLEMVEVQAVVVYEVVLEVQALQVKVLLGGLVQVVLRDMTLLLVVEEELAQLGEVLLIVHRLELAVLVIHLTLHGPLQHQAV